MNDKTSLEILPRERVLSCAEKIIRSSGVEALTMRRLAKDADVALKTPYNLFGSKTGVLLKLLDKATIALVQNLAAEDNGHAVIQLFRALRTLESFYSTDEDYYREIFWAVMTSDHPEERAAAHANIVALVTLKIEEAIAKHELKRKGTAPVLGEQLGLNLLANLGSWAGGHLSIQTTVRHTETVWSALLMPLLTKNIAIELRSLFADDEQSNASS